MRALASTVSAVALALLAVSSVAQAQGATNDFGSDGSGAVEGGGETMLPGGWAPSAAPVPTSTQYAYWRDSSSHYDSSSSSSSSSSGSYNGSYDDDDEVGMEYYYPDVSGGVERTRRSKHYFSPVDGFSLTTSDAATGVQPGNCAWDAYCIHVVFESDYGAMSTFDAFYLDSFESVGGPIGAKSFTAGGPAPLVLGRFPQASIDRLGANWSQVFNWNDTRRTTWTFSPVSGSPNFNELDLTLSLKQVYTALPGFYDQHADSENMGPLYSSNLTDQVVIRVNTFVVNEYTSASGMLPIVVNHTGSQLVDINITSTRLYTTNARNDSNEIQLTVKIGRRKYGGIAPWIPVRASQCFSPPSWFAACLEANGFSLRQAADDLLSYKTDRTVIDLRPIIKLCAKTAPQAYAPSPWTYPPNPQTYPPSSGSSGSWTGDGSRGQPFAPTETGSWGGGGPPSNPPPPLGSGSWGGNGPPSNPSTPPGSGSWGGNGFQSNPPGPPGPGGSGSWGGDGPQSNPPAPTGSGSSNGDGGMWTGAPNPFIGDPLHDLDDMLAGTSFRYPRCVLNDITMKADGEAVVLSHEPATTRIDFGVPSFSFYLVVEVDDQIVTTHVFTSAMSPFQIADEIHSELAQGRQWLRLRVNFANNTDEIEDVRRRNRWAMQAYEDALRWSRTSASSPGSESSSDNSASWDYEQPSAGSASSGDGSGDWNAGEGDGPFAGVHLPKRPRLLPVPVEKYSVLITFENLAIVPRVRYVYSNVSDMGFSIDDGKLALELLPLLQVDVRYTPPPQDLDLEWHDEPLWKTQARKLLRKLPMGDSCSQCLKPFERCLLNEDCVFGVNSYFAEAMRWDRWVNQTNSTTTTFDVSDAVRQARLFFPGKGFEKLQGLLLCWFKSKCSLSEPPAPVFNETTGMLEKSQALSTRFVFKPTTLDISMQNNRFAIFTNGDKLYSEYIYCGSGNYWSPAYWSGQNFLSKVVFQADPAYVRSFSVQIDCNPYGSSPSQYSLKWSDGFVEPLQVDAQDAGYYTSSQASSVSSPWTLSIEMPGSGNDNIQSPWPRLESWLNLFRSVPFGISIGSINATNGTNATDSTPDWTLPSASPPSSPSAVCPACADLLMACTANSACAAAARAWLAWVLPGGSINSTADWDGFTRLRWLGNPFSNDSVSDEFREPLLNFVACLSKYKCAVGYRAVSNQSNTTVPTTVRLRVNRKAAVPMWTNVAISHGSLSPVIARSSDDVQAFADQIRAATDEDVGGYWGYDMYSGDVLNFTGSLDAIRQIRLVTNDSRTAFKPDTFSVRFQSPTPHKPSWSYLLSWFGVDFRPHNDTQCAACMPKLRECYVDGGCWQQIHDNVLPVLERKRGWLQQWYETISDGHARYRADIGSQFFNNYVVTSMPASATDYMGIFKCFAVAKCDVSAMDTAVDPPATAYVPSYLTIEPATMSLYLYPDTTLSLYGRQYSHTGSISDLETFLRGALSGRNFPFTITGGPANDSNAGPGMTAYNVAFSNDVFTFGDVPYVNVIGSGKKPMSDSRWYRDPYASTNPSRLYIESMNQWPQWDRLISLLSVPPVRDLSNVTAASGLNCEAAQQAKQECYQDYGCMWDFSSGLLRRLQTALVKAPSYNPSSGLFEIDLSAVAQPTYTRTANLLEQWALCAANGTGASRPTFSRGSVKLECPLEGPLYVQGYASINQDSPDDEVLQYIANYNRGRFPSRTKTESSYMYEVALSGSFGDCPLTLSWLNDATGERIQSTCTPSRLGFQSESFDVYEASLPWLKWLPS